MRFKRQGRFVLSGLLLLICLKPFYGSEDRIARWKLFGGCNLSGVSSPNNFWYENKTLLSFYGGAGVEIRGKISFEMDLLYISKGYRSIENYESDWGHDYDVAVENKIKNFVRELSLSLLWKFNFGKTVHPFLSAGLDVAYVLSQKYECYIMENDPYLGISRRYYENTDLTSERFDPSVIVGGGVKFPVGFFTVFAEVRYYWGLLNIGFYDTFKSLLISLGIEY